MLLVLHSVTSCTSNVTRQVLYYFFYFIILFKAKGRTLDYTGRGTIIIERDVRIRVVRVVTLIRVTALTLHHTAFLLVIHCYFGTNLICAERRHKMITPIPCKTADAVSVYLNFLFLERSSETILFCIKGAYSQIQSDVVMFFCK
jgi:hypothetical protein